jgi:hypothetical protein
LVVFWVCGAHCSPGTPEIDLAHSWLRLRGPQHQACHMIFGR